MPTIPGPGQYSVSTPKSPGSPIYSMARADKYQKLIGPLLPGPCDYYIPDKAPVHTPKPIITNRNIVERSGNSMPTMHSTGTIN